MPRDDAPPESGRVRTYAEQAIHALLTDRPIAYHPVLARAVKSVTGGVLLSQLLYWTPRSHDPDGWVRKTQDDITDETALTRREQETAREACRKVGVLEWKIRGIPGKLHYRVDIRKLTELLAAVPPPDLGNDAAEGVPPVGPSHGPTPTAREGPRPATARITHANQGWRNTPTKDGGIRQAGMTDHANQEGAIPPTSDGGSVQRITETTSEITTENDVVVAALRARGISSGIAIRLAQAHPDAYILAKCELVDWLVETRSRSVGKNAAGYLRRAIEEDYRPPPKYRSKAERDAEAAERATAIAEQERRQREQAEEDGRALEVDLDEVRRQYPSRAIPHTDLTTEDAWALTLATLERTLSGPNFEMFLRRTLLLTCDGDQAQIGARTTFDVEQLATRLDRHIARALSETLGRQIHCTYTSLSKVLNGAALTSPEELGKPGRRRDPQPGTPAGVLA